MELLLCNTNLAVTTVVCQIAKEPSKKFIVLTDVINIYRFLSLLDYANAELYFIESSFSFDTILGLFKTKRRIKRIIQNNNISKVYHYHRVFGQLYNWVISYCARKGCQVINYKVKEAIDFPLAKKNLKYFKTKLLQFLLYSGDVEILDKGGGSYIPKLSPSFFQKYKIQISDYKIDDSIIKDSAGVIIKKMGLKVNNKNIILLNGSVMATGQVDSEEYKEKIRLLIEAIGCENIVAKCHPRFNDETEEEKRLKHIPSFIPMDFLLMYYDVIIGYNSTTLRYASALGKKAISLIDFFVPTNIERKNNWYATFADSEIYYPKSPNDLVNIIEKQ